ncbi:hypothetical protein L7F22_062903 [Adiantum nelumboides]|nr:hypothetical protein [Adiantum nelumboides]
MSQGDGVSRGEGFTIGVQSGGEALAGQSWALCAFRLSPVFSEPRAPRGLIAAGSKADKFCGLPRDDQTLQPGGAWHKIYMQGLPDGEEGLPILVSASDGSRSEAMGMLALMSVEVVSFFWQHGQGGNSWWTGLGGWQTSMLGGFSKGLVL